ncbi:sigma-70 family RNA polymerase sigma factor [Flagellimonas pacifica]|uniref:RNA polymerase, sigma subunit, SigZ n=1 Tax=Flagellimonas pacifica TaxID=1247520 RepID=A0A285MTS5_9FLAO|nr:sigma-70 family RNA polymerase sigma factor [Allomuricauda parva]SNZ00599.1 RNA polymerase, sigma subunit, SigZ [Allomuricauda parva]
MKYENVWNIYEDWLRNFITSKVDDVEDVNDILQEVSVKLYVSLLEEKEIRNPKNWLFQVTRNTISDFYRKKYLRKNTYEISSDLSEQTCICDLSDFVIKNYLPKKYADTLFLSEIEQLSQKEVAKTLGISLTATKSRILRGRKMFKELIEDCLNISYNKKGQAIDFELKNSCSLPNDIKEEMQRLNLVL